MKKFIIKVIILTTVVYSIVVGVNYLIDPANIYHESTVNKVVELLNDHHIVKVPANFDEGVFQEKRISTMEWQPETVIIGSSHVMYIPFEYDNVYNAGMSGSYLGEYYAIIGLLKQYDRMPKRVIIGVDSWAFMQSVENGRYTSIKKYAICLQEDMGIFDKKAQEREYVSRKFEELISFSYFQASVESYKKNGLRKMVESVEIACDSTISDAQKILVDGRRVPSLEDYHSLNDINYEIEQILNSGSVYKVGKEYRGVKKEYIDQFELLLQYLQDYGVDVQLYLPAWHPRVYKYFCENGAFAGVSEVEDVVRQLGHKYNIPVRGGYDPSICGITEKDFMDWLHLTPEKMKENYDFVVDGSYTN